MTRRLSALLQAPVSPAAPRDAKRAPEEAKETLNSFWAVPWPTFAPVSLLQAHNFSPRPVPAPPVTLAETADLLAEASPYGERFVEPREPVPVATKIERRIDKLKLDLGLVRARKGKWIRSSKLRAAMKTDVGIVGVLDVAKIPEEGYGDEDIAAWRADAEEMRRLRKEGYDPTPVLWGTKSEEQLDREARAVHARAMQEMQELVRFRPQERNRPVDRPVRPETTTKTQTQPEPPTAHKKSSNPHDRLQSFLKDFEEAKELPNETARVLSDELKGELQAKFQENIGQGLWRDTVTSRIARPLDAEQAFCSPALQLTHPETTIKFGGVEQAVRAETTIYSYVDVDKSATMKHARWVAGIAEAHLALDHPERAFDTFAKAAALFLSETSAADDRDPDEVFPYSREAHDAAAAIQRAVRRRRETLHGLSRKLAWVWRGYVVRRELWLARDRLRIAARCIQKVYLRRHWFRTLAAICIQKRQRGITGRIRFWSVRNTPPAITVYYWWKVVAAKAELFRRKVFVVKTKLAIRTVQRFARWIKFRKFEIEVEKVQRAYRHHLWLRWRFWAATKIQGGCKVFMTRRRFKTEREAALELERVRREEEDLEVSGLQAYVQLWADAWIQEHPNGTQELANEIRRQKLKRRAQQMGRASKEQLQYREALEAFEQFDDDGSGELDRDELKLLMQELCLPVDERTMDDVMAVLDEDGSGDVDFDEFFHWYVSEDHDDPTMALAKLKLQGRRLWAQLTGEDLVNKGRAALMKATLQSGELMVRRAFRLYHAPRFCCPQCEEPFALFGQLRAHLPKGRCPIAGVSAAAAAHTMTADQMKAEEVLLREEEEQQEVDEALGLVERDMGIFLSTPEGSSQLQSLAKRLKRNFHDAQRLIGKMENPDERQALTMRLVFDVFDSDRSGELDRNEFKQLLHYLRIPVSDSQLDGVMSLVDSSLNGTVEFEEFFGWLTYEGAFTKARTGVRERLRNHKTQLGMKLRGTFFVEEARRVLLARARHDARIWTREEYRKRFPPTFFCDVCFDSFKSEEEMLDHFLEDEAIHGEMMARTERLFARSKLPNEARQHMAANGLQLTVAEHRLALLLDDANHRAGEETVAYLETEEGKAELETEAAELRILDANRKAQLSGMDGEERERLEVQEMFNLFDVDSSGAIDREELEELVTELALGVPAKKIGPLMLQMDTDGSGVISFNEFYNWYSNDRKRTVKSGFLSLRRKAGNLVRDTAVLKARMLMINRARLEARQHVKREETAQITSLADASTNLARMARLAAAEAEAQLKCGTFLRSKQGKHELATQVGNLQALVNHRAKTRGESKVLSTLRATFDIFDTEGKGEISVDELRHLVAALNITVPRADVEHLAEVMDADGSGTLSYEEFRMWYQHESRKPLSLRRSIKQQARERILSRYRTQARIAYKLESASDVSTAAKGHLAEHDDPWFMLPMAGDPDAVEESMILNFAENRALEQMQERLLTEDGRYDFEVEVERLRAARAVKDRMQAKMSAADRRKEDVNYVFDLFDVDGSGSIDSAELQDLLKHLGMPVSDSRVALLLVEMDDDNSGTIDFGEFYAWYLEELAKKGCLTRLRRARRPFSSNINAAIRMEAKRAMLSRARAEGRYVARTGHKGMKARRRALQVFNQSGSTLQRPERVKTAEEIEAEAVLHASKDTESAEERRAKLHIAHAERDAELAVTAFLDTPEGRSTLQREVVRLEQREMDARRREAHLSAEEQRRAQVHRVFIAFDDDGSGEIDVQELEILLKELAIPLRPGDLNKIMAQMDADGSGDVDFEEFYDWYSNALSATGFFGKLARVRLQLANVVSNTLERQARLEMTSKARQRARHIAQQQVDALRDPSVAAAAAAADIGDPATWFQPALPGSRPGSSSHPHRPSRPGSGLASRPGSVGSARPGSSESAGTNSLRPLSSNARFRPLSGQSKRSGSGSDSRPGTAESGRSRPWSHRSDDLSLFGGEGTTGENELGQKMERALAASEASRAAAMYLQTTPGQTEVANETARLRELRLGLEFKGYDAGTLAVEVVRYHFGIFEVGTGSGFMDTDDLPELMADLGRPIPELEINAVQRQLRDEYNMVDFELFYQWFQEFRPEPVSRLARAARRTTRMFQRGGARSTIPQDAARLIRNRFLQEARQQIAVNYAEGPLGTVEEQPSQAQGTPQMGRRGARVRTPAAELGLGETSPVGSPRSAYTAIPTRPDSAERVPRRGRGRGRNTMVAGRGAQVLPTG